MVLGKTVVHGIYALCYLSRLEPGGVAPSTTIAEAVGVPPEHARKILTCLTAAELVTSVRGRSGGYVLARSPEDISVLEVWDALTPGAGLSALEFRTCPVASGDGCCLRSGLADLRDHLRQALAERTLASVIGECHRPSGRAVAGGPGRA